VIRRAVFYVESVSAPFSFRVVEEGRQELSVVAPDAFDEVERVFDWTGKSIYY